MMKEILSLSGARQSNLEHFLGVFFILVFAGISVSFGQTPSVTSTPSSPPSVKPAGTPSLERNFLKNILKDQKVIWTSPFRLRKNDMNWLVPLTAATAGLIATDRKTAGALSDNQARIDFSRRISLLGSVYTTGGAAFTFYAIGKISGNQKAKETGLLAGEALINSALVVQVFKLTTQRPRPLEKNGRGTFFSGGDSFPSGHSASAWALAAVIADEYGKQHPIVKYGAYGLATAVSLSRYTACRHFLSDILVGSAIGYGIGRYAFLRHHDTGLDSSNKIKKTTKLEKYFPMINPQYDARRRIYGANLVWNL